MPDKVAPIYIITSSLEQAHINYIIRAHLSNGVIDEMSTLFETGSGSGSCCGTQLIGWSSGRVIQEAWLDGWGCESSNFDDQITTSVSMSISSLDWKPSIHNVTVSELL